jgi:hypothetical protein
MITWTEESACTFTAQHTDCGRLLEQGQPDELIKRDSAGAHSRMHHGQHHHDGPNPHFKMQLKKRAPQKAETVATHDSATRRQRRSSKATTDDGAAQATNPHETQDDAARFCTNHSGSECSDTMLKYRIKNTRF